MRYERIWLHFVSAVWAIQPDKLKAIEAFLLDKIAGADYTPEEIRARIGLTAGEAEEIRAAARAQTLQQAGSIAVIPLQGIIAQRLSAMDEISGPGGTSTESFAKAFKAALADETVTSIIIDVNSPGGTVYGVPELADLIYKSRGQKPILASVNSIAFSAAYWIATAADQVYVTPSGEVGSIGVFAEHIDISEQQKMKGIKTTLIAAGKYKTEGNRYEPLTEEARAELQSVVDRYKQMFVNAIARQRGISVATVNKDFGDGRMFGADQAVKIGMADKVGTFDQVVKRLTGAKAENVLDIFAVPPKEIRDLDASATTVNGDHAPVSTEKAPSPPVAGPVRPHRTGTSDGPWDGPANEARLPSPMSIQTARNSYAWIDDAGIENGQVRKVSCKFVHHEISADGRPGAANMTACSTGIGVLNGGRGGANIPREDRPGVHDHLAKHLRDGGREAPPLTENPERDMEALEREKAELELLSL